MDENNKDFIKNKIIERTQFNNSIYTKFCIVKPVLFILFLYIFVGLSVISQDGIYNYKMYIFSFLAILYPIWYDLKEYYNSKYQNTSIYIDKIMNKNDKTILKIVNKGKSLENLSELVLFDNNNNIIDVKYFQFIEENGEINIEVEKLKNIKCLKYKINVYNQDYCISLKYVQLFLKNGERVNNGKTIMTKQIFYKIFNIKNFLFLIALLYIIFQIIDIIFFRS